MKKIGLIVVLQLLVLFSFSQLQGRVVTATGEALPGANVSLSKGTEKFFADYITASDVSGRFSIDVRQPGNYTLKISYLGYQTTFRKISIPAMESLLIRLEEESYLSDEVLVTASRASDQMPIVRETIGKDEIESDLMAQDLPYLLSLTPGLVESSETGIGIGYSGLRIRGTDPSRINVTINGVPLNDAENQVVFWVDLPDISSSVDEIQIQRGVGTSSNGASAFGASINLKTTGLNKEASASISSMGGSYQTLKNSVELSSGIINNHFTFDARYSMIQAGSYIQHGFSNLQSLYLAGAWFGKNDILKATIMHGSERTGITWWGVPDYMIDSVRNYNPSGVYYDADGIEHYYENTTDNYLQTHYQLHYSHQFNPNLLWNSALHLTHGGGYYEQFQDDANSYHSTLFSEYGLPSIYISSGNVIYQSDLIHQKWIVNDFYGLTTNLNYHTNTLNLIGGASVNQYDGNHFGMIKWLELNYGVPQDYEWYRNKAVKTEGSVFARGTYTLMKKLSMYVDVQYRAILYTMDGLDDDLKLLRESHNYGFINPKIGAQYKLDNHQTAYISYSVANREPTRTDIKEAAGDPAATPKAETLFDLEAGYEYQWAKGKLGVNLYHMNYLNQLVPTGQKSNVGYDIMTNIPSSYRFGLELTAGLSPFSWLKWAGNASFSKNRIKSYLEYASYYDADWNEYYLSANLGETHLSYSPESVINSRFSFILQKNLTIDFVSKYVGAMYYDNSSDENRKLDPYFINNVSFSYRIYPDWMEEMDLQLQIKNIFNQQYISSAYGGNWFENAVISGTQVISADEKSWAYFFPQAGIQIYGGITLKF